MLIFRQLIDHRSSTYTYLLADAVGENLDARVATSASLPARPRSSG